MRAKVKTSVWKPRGFSHIGVPVLCDSISRAVLTFSPTALSQPPHQRCASTALETNAAATNPHALARPHPDRAERDAARGSQSPGRVARENGLKEIMAESARARAAS